MTARPDPLTLWIANSRRRVRTGCGWPTSPMLLPGRGSRMSRWGSTHTHGSSSAGGSRTTYEPIWLSTLWSKHSGPADRIRPIPAGGWCITRTPAVKVDSNGRRNVSRVRSCNGSKEGS